MKLRFCSFLLALILVACVPSTPSVVPGMPNLPTRTNTTGTAALPTPSSTLIRVPDPKSAATGFLDAWKAVKYEDMYNQLTGVTRDAVKQADFINRYTDVAANLTLQSLDYEILSTMTKPQTAQVAYRVTFHTTLAGDVVRDTLMNLSLENGQWLVQWEDGMIMPELRGGNRLVLTPKTPARANIYDHAGIALAGQSDILALGVMPDKVDVNQESGLIAELARDTGKPSSMIEALIENNRNGGKWFVSIGEVPIQEVQDRIPILTNFTGIVVNTYSSRLYYDSGLAVHAVGYVLPISKEDLAFYQGRGYAGNEKVGYAGLEKWGENYLAGVHGGSIYVASPDGKNTITRLAQADPAPSQAIYTTIDADLQRGVRKSLTGFKGAVVVMERDTGRVLAMVSSPDYDPNLLDTSNDFSQYERNNILSSADRVLLNRATQGGYPLGSVFKIITMAAGLESGVFNVDSSYMCGDAFTELEGTRIENWTVSHKLPADGKLSLPEALMRSCNPWFNHIGLDLYRQKGSDFLAKMARAFGLGSATGIGQLAEDTGSMPDAQSELDAAYLAIGQGSMLVTPLQVVDFVAAVGNGGTLYRPQLIEKIQPPEGSPTYTFKSEIRGKLPVSPDNLKIIQDAMRTVVENKRGTAFRTFTGLNVPVFGKTGTAQTSLDKPHAWFAGYTDSARTDKPNIAVVVIAENAGEGSEIAAPIFRRVIEYYYDGKAGRLYPWESQYYVTKTPTPSETGTPVPPSSGGNSAQATDTPQP